MNRPRPGVAPAFASRAAESCEDPTVAPGAYKGDGQAPRWSIRRAVQNMLWVYAVGLLFLVFGVSSVATSGDPPVEIIVQGVLVALIGLSYLFTAWIADTSLVVRWCYIAGFVGLLLLHAPWWGWSFVNYGVYVSIMLATLIPWRQARVAIVAVNVAIALVAIVTADSTPVLIALIGSVVGLSTGAGIEAGRIGARLHRAEQRVSALALVAERERIGRDLHDILGHSLTAISIKADLAEKLIERDPAAAKAEIAELSIIARQSLADVRATASGIREVRVAAEIASARSVLAAAGIEPVTPTAVEPMPDATSELFGYVIREAVTNVVRHSEARQCVITVSAREVSVSDDGRGISDRTAGSGLRGLADRIEAAGGALEVESRPTGGTRVRAELPVDQVNGPVAPSGRDAAEPVRP